MQAVIQAGIIRRVTNNLKQFIRSGCLPRLALGMSREEVRRAVGEPHDTSVTGQPGAETIWKYGPFELHFESERLARFYADHFAERLTRMEVESALEEVGISFRSQPYPYEPEAEVVVTSLGSAVLFDATGRAVAMWAPAEHRAV